MNEKVTKQKGFKGGVNLGRKTALKKSKINVDKVEKIVEDIEANNSPKKEKTSRASVIIPQSEYVRMKEALLAKEQETGKYMSISSYLRGLMKADLGI